MDARTEANFGRDDGIKCWKCQGPTFLSYDQGGGLVSYDCENEACGEITQVQFDDCEDDVPDPDYYEPPFDQYIEDE